ncbi:hypothetical protein DY000_02016666 [Brassica cretica]|uniref:No apical meristem-associated C-terminal domain-containing protein n=1 Tax=Brassica cretica TaxID=69181 RepID=A0ABQ7CYJ7_BRACR|nr:hypothetical protein DY000_02016666 [Brassica cretica]
MSGNTKDKTAVRNNAGKTTPAATAHIANDYANAIVPKKKSKKNLAATFRQQEVLRDELAISLSKHKEK